MLYMAQPTFPLYVVEPTFPIFAFRWDELAQPEQTATPSSIPSDTLAALCDIIRSRWRIRIDLAQRTREVATRGPSHRRPRAPSKWTSGAMLRRRAGARAAPSDVRAPGYLARTRPFVGDPRGGHGPCRLGLPI